MTIPDLILASTSPYRRAQFENLGLRFGQSNPNADESVQAGESPEAMACRLAETKARSVASQLSAGQWLVAGSDQVCHHRGDIMRKPGSRETAIAHLSRFSGDWVTFSTGLSLINHNGQCETGLETFRVQFKELSPGQISRYVDLDEPFDCAGAIKVEKLGITLLSDTRGRDVNSLVGMPLMLLGELLEAYSLSIMDFTK